LKKLVVGLQDSKYGNSWLDSVHTGRNYSTAMALLVLSGEKIFAFDPVQEKK
jgi:hypothetical protein